MWFLASVLGIALGVGGVGSVASAQVVRLGDNAVTTAQFVQATQAPAQRTKASVAMRNTGVTTWTAGTGYALASLNPKFGFGPLPIPAGVSIAPGQVASFNYDMVGPAVTGLYEFRV